MKLIKTLIICSLVALAPTVHAQRLRLLADIELVGFGLVNQTINYGHYTSTESLTGMSAFNAGLNVQLPRRFECSLIGGTLVYLNLNSISASSNSNSSPYAPPSTSTTFTIPKVGFEFSRSFIWNESRFASGLNFGAGIEHYWPGTFDSMADYEEITIHYNGATGYYFRAKLVFREGERFQLEPNITYRSFDLVASDYKKSVANEPLDPSMLNLQARNVSIGIVIYLGLSSKK